MSCRLLTPGPQQGVALFAVEDNCYTPVYGTDAGYFDSCATVGAATPVTSESRPAFEKFCPNGDVRAYLPARTVVTTSDIQINFPWLPVEWLSTVGAYTPTMFNGEIVGGSPSGEAVNLLALVWQLVIGLDGCSGTEQGAPSIVTAWAVQDARFASDGDFGTSGFNYTIVGKTVDANIGSGPIPLFYDSGDPTEAAWTEECLLVTKDGQTRWEAFGPPDECGAITTTEPEDACTTAS